MRVFSPNCRHKSCSYGQPNFGAIEIDWNAVTPWVKIELRDLQGNSVDGVEFPISELKPSNAHANKKEGHSFEAHCSLETELPWLVRYRLAMLFFGTIAGPLNQRTSAGKDDNCKRFAWQFMLAEDDKFSWQV
ncbi:hypothetical protein TRIUR3_25048 [Triticum urartu]|uniref:Uncharacterized protein n=1 Tax=Triticum urartu TaxID=4572 RepID=M7ZMA8_TRIUA|nr:hypothetical protein TRIUR3_25048 [Triticum urartu]